MDREIIKAFRNKANEQNYCCEHYSDVDGKNQWNCMCSAMDWISVAVDEIDFHPLSCRIGHNPKATMDVLMLLMRVALIKEGVEQLHRVIYGTSEMYLKDEKSVWANNDFNMTDNQYFETLRAYFGVHPINLNGFRQNDKEDKCYASWSYGGLDGFEVSLYPRKTDGKDCTLPISFERLERYATRRYNHLRDMVDVLDRRIAQEVQP